MGQWDIEKPDVDNLAKFYLDVLSGIVFEDDARVVILECEKRWGDRSETRIEVSEL